MRRIWSCIFYSLCVFAVAFSLFWMALPLVRPEAGAAERTPASEQGLSAQAQPNEPVPEETAYYICDEGGRVAVYACGEDGAPVRRTELTAIYVNLLPEGDALRIKHGITVKSEKELFTLLEDLGR